MTPVATPETLVFLLNADERETAVIKRSKRSRHIRITITDAAVIEVSAPQHVTQKAIAKALEERRVWLANHLEIIRDKNKTTIVDLFAGDPIRLHGQWIPTRLENGSRNSVEYDRESLSITVGFAGDPYEVLEGWMREYARDVFTHRTGHWARELDMTFEKITIRDQKTRWGSCSTTGTVSFNWRLVMAPLWVMDAIIVHELCHTVEMNHSDRFWTLLNNAYPDHDRAQEWLNDVGMQLRITPPDGYEDRLSLGRVASPGFVADDGPGVSSSEDSLTLF